MVSQRSSPILVAMKRTKLFITFLSSAAFVIGCNKEATTSEQLDKVQAKTEQTAQEIKDYSYAQKSEFVEKMRGQITALNADLDQLSAEIETSGVARPNRPVEQATRRSQRRHGVHLG